MKAALVFISLYLAAAQSYRISDVSDNSLDEQVRVSLRERFEALVRRQQLERQRAEAEQMQSQKVAEAVLKKKCGENGPPGAYDKLKVAIADFQTCVQAAVMSDNEPAEGGIRGAALKTCRIMRPVGSCVISLEGAIMPCMTPERRLNLPITNITRSAISYTCDDDASRLRDLIAGDGIDCFKSKIAQMKQCTHSMNSNEVITSIESEEVTENDCQKVAEMEQCMEKQLRTCYHPAASNFFRGMLDTVNKFSPCYKGASQRLVSMSP